MKASVAALIKHGYSPSKRVRSCLMLGVVFATFGISMDGAEAPSTYSPVYAPRMSLTDLSLAELLEVQFDTVSTASRRSQRIWEAPASVSIVTREEIKSFGYRTLADALGGAPGVYLTDDRYYTYLGLRGFSRPGDYNSRVLLLVDGSRANDNIYDSGWIGHESPVDVDNIERVELIRGPSSSLYGSSAFFGTVNVISRRGGSLNGVEATAEAGSLDTTRGRLAAGHLLRSGLEYFVAVSHYDSGGQKRLYYAEYDTPDFNFGVAENLDYERATHFTGNAIFRGFTLSAVFNSRVRGIPTAGFESHFNDPRAQTEDIGGHADLKFEHEFANGLHLTMRTGYHWYEYHGVYPYNEAAPDEPALVTLNIDEAHGEWWGTETTVSRKIFDQITLTGGGEFRRNLRQDQSNYTLSEPVVDLLESQATSTVLGGYVQADWAIRSNLILSTGFRIDHYSSFGSTKNPRLGLLYQPWEGTTAKLLYGRAFRAPNAYELYYVYYDQAGNPELRPETIETYEAAFEQALTEAVKFTASGSYYQVKDLIAFDYSPTVYSFANQEQAETVSGELGLEGRWPSGWFGRVSYTAQRAEDGDGLELTNSPRSLAKAHVRMPLAKDRIFLGVDVQYIGSAKAVKAGRVDPSWVANATLYGRRIAPGFEVSASVYNLFDRDVGSTGFEDHRQRVLYRNGRSLRVRLTYTY
jgi:outer membrane receptor for ferrienterochelin and colicins